MARSVGTKRPASSGVPADWPMYRGNPARVGCGNWNGSLGEPRWQAKTFDEQESQLRAWGPIESFSEAAWSSVQPLVVGNLVLLRNPRRLLAVNWQSGRRVWEYPWEQPAERPVDLRTNPSEYVRIQNRLHREYVLWGQLSSDGQRVYLLDDAALKLGGANRTPVQNYRLVALDLRQEGRLSWAVGGANGEDEPKLAGAEFLGSPVPDGPQLYVLAEIRDEIRLCQLQASSGRLAWSQVVARPTLHVFFDSLRRSAGVAPSVAEGLVVCPTLTGAVVAVDAATHSLVWGFPYHWSKVRRNHVSATLAALSMPEMTVTISGRRVVVTPPDSDQLYCLDLFTGEELWSCNCSAMGYLGCVHDGRAVLVGPHEVTALRISDRKPAWCPASLQIPSDGVSHGRGLYAGHYYYLPTSGKQLLAINLDDGRLTATIKTDHVLGSLVGVRNCLISQSPDVVEQFGAAERGHATER